MKLGFQISILQFNLYLKKCYKTNIKKMIINNLKRYLRNNRLHLFQPIYISKLRKMNLSKVKYF